jgi:hypothetical protein
VERLIDGLTSSVEIRRSSARMRRVAWIAVAIAIAMAVAGYTLRRPIAELLEPRITLRAQSATVSEREVRAMLVANGFYAADQNAAGAGLASDYRQRAIHGDPIVVDPRTGLMWQQNGSGKLLSFEAAEAYVVQLNADELAGFDDWRLPTLEEAMSLMRPPSDEGTHIAPAFDFGAAPFVWTSDRDSAERRWVVYYGDGIGDPERSSYNAFARVVRSRG